MNLNYISAESRKAISSMIIRLLIYTVNIGGRRYRGNKTLPITVEFVDNFYKSFRWRRSNIDAFFIGVADDINWTVMGTHPLTGVYNSKADFLKILLNA
jgi:hypothetical protein